MRWLPWAGWCSFSLFFFCGMVVGHLFWCFCFIHFWRVVVWEPLVWRFCWAGGSRLWCVAWCGGCVSSLLGFIGFIVDFTFFVYGDNSCCSLFWLSRWGFSVSWWWCFFVLVFGVLVCLRWWVSFLYVGACGGWYFWVFALQ